MRLIGKLLNLTIKSRIILIFVIVFTITITLVAVIRANQVHAHIDQLMSERLLANAEMTFAVLDTVQQSTLWILQNISRHAYYGFANGSDMERIIGHMFEDLNSSQDGLFVYENFLVFDTDFNIFANANPVGDTISMHVFYESFGVYMTEFWVSPSFVNSESGRMQLVFSKPVIRYGEIVAFAVIIGNTEMIQFFLRDFPQVYNSFVNVADAAGTILFSTRPKAYLGRHVDELGVYEAFGKIPMNTVFHHNSALTGIDKIAYVTADTNLNWVIISFFDADAVESTGILIFSSVFPTVLGMLVAAVLIIFVIVRSLEPINMLTESANEVAKGNVALNLYARSNDEIGKVSRSFLRIITALNILGNNFENAKKAIERGDTNYNLSDFRIGGIFDEMLDNANVIIKQMQQSMLEARQASEAKSDFLATISHEIRTPMNAILGIAQIQLQKGNLPNHAAVAFQKIYSSGDILLGIINDILDMSKIEAGKFELNPNEYDIPSLINDTVQLNIVRLGSKPINFIVRLDENLPTFLIGDELRIKQILNNLLSNAIKYTEKGYIKFSADSSLADADTMLRFVIEDTGQGMKPEDLECLFNAYARFNLECNRNVEGVGIGLTITDKLVKMMDGTIEVTSEFGKGSVFTVKIKQKAVEGPPIGLDIAKQISNFSFSCNKAKTQIAYVPMPYGSILIVDDLETNLYVAEGLLAPYGAKIETVTSGYAALEKVGKGRTYDIIFMDHMMPQMDGIETTQTLRMLGYDGTIVALTANALVGNDEMFMQNGFDGFISKPIDVRNLDSILKKFIRDKYTEEASKYMPVISSAVEKPNPEILKVFCRDAKKAVVNLRQTISDGDIKLFITTVHAMKSALANIGERDSSLLASELEHAGLNSDLGFIRENTERFVLALEKLAENFDTDREFEVGQDVQEDSVYLKEQLIQIKTACDDYDDEAAYAAFDRLKEKSWKKETVLALEDMREALFLRSDFEDVSAAAHVWKEKL